MWIVLQRTKTKGCVHDTLWLREMIGSCVHKGNWLGIT